MDATHATAMGTERPSHLKLQGFKPMKSALARAFNADDTTSACGVEGLAKAHPSRLGTLGTCAPSGLARAQQVFMAQKFLNVPAMPSYVKHEGGLVLDRVVANVGAGEWWSTLTCRVRAQRAWETPNAREGKAHRALLDPSMYALGGRFRTSVLDRVVVKAIGELGSVQGVTEAIASKFKAATKRGADAAVEGDGAAVGAGNKTMDPTKTRGRLSIQSKIPAHIVSMDISHNERHQMSEGYVDGPTSASVSVASRGRRALNYRIGARKWLSKDLPAFEPAPGGGLRKPPRKELQAGASFEQQFVLWRGRRRRKANSTQAQTGYTAMPQVPTLSIGGIYGAVARKSLDDDYSSGRSVEFQNFGSIAVHAQAGSFSRPLLDFTSVNLRIDAAGVGGSSRPLDAENQKPMSLADRFITMDGRLKANLLSVTLSLGQQLIGPLRLRAEVRASGGEALNATRAGISAIKARKPLNEVTESVTKQLLSPEVIYGVDCALPPVLGSARVVAWYNVTRQEGFAEMRLFDL